MLQKLAKTSSTSMQNRLYSPQENGRDIMRFSFRMCDVIRSNVTRRNVIGCNNESIMLMTLQVCRSFASFCYIYILFYSSISSIFLFFSRAVGLMVQCKHWDVQSVTNRYSHEATSTLVTTSNSHSHIFTTSPVQRFFSSQAENFNQLQPWLPWQRWWRRSIQLLNPGMST